jgi:hypothetical protein
MANRLDTNPIFIDTWSADVVLAERGKPIVIGKIVMFSATAGDKFALDTADTTKQIFMKTTDADGRCHEVDFTGLQGQGWRITEGCTIDVSDCSGYDANDLVWIYLAG